MLGSNGSSTRSPYQTHGRRRDVAGVHPSLETSPEENWIARQKQSVRPLSRFIVTKGRRTHGEILDQLIPPGFSSGAVSLETRGNTLVQENLVETRTQPSRVKQGRVTGPVRLVAELLKLWQLNERQGAVLLGLDNEAYMRDLLNGVSTLRGRDTKDRIRLLARVHASLNELFRDEAAELQWITGNNTEFGDTSPLSVMLKGSMTDLLWVTEYLDHVSGR